MTDAQPDPWPPRRLRLRTPRLELRPDDDAGLHELAAEAARGVHPPERMPFSSPWTDAPAGELGRNALRYHWRARAELGPQEWQLNFLVRLNGAVIGAQNLHATDFAVTREVATGSWIGMRHQGDGVGTEMRAAVLLFAFDHLGTRTARSGGFTDNPASLGVSRKLGYVEDGTNTRARRGAVAVEQRMMLSRERFAEFRPPWTLAVEGVACCLPLLLGDDA